MPRAISCWGFAVLHAQNSLSCTDSVLQKGQPVQRVLECRTQLVNVLYLFLFCRHLRSLRLPVFSTTCHHTHNHIHTPVAENNAQGATCSLGIMFECVREDLALGSNQQPLHLYQLDPPWTVNANLPLVFQVYLINGTLQW